MPPPRADGPDGVLPVSPSTPASIESVAAMMKQGCYRSVDQRASRAKDRRAGLGHAWADLLDRARCLASRSANRGLRPVHQAAAFPLPAVMALELQDAALAQGGPAAPSRVIEAT